MTIKRLIGTDANQVPLNRDLGTMAYQDAGTFFGPNFSTYITGSPSIPNGAWTKVGFNNTAWDSHGYFDTTNNWFLPKIPGWYQFNYSVRFTSASSYTGVAMYKNGSGSNPTGKYGTLLQVSISANIGLTGSAIYYLNGSTDYVAVYGYSNVSSQTVVNDSTASIFDGIFIRGQ
jgi:hypothetical protein